MAKLRLATVWLGGCSGCHMSFLDLDEWLLELARLAEVVYSPIMDVKEFPQDVDVTLVEGAVANEENLHMIRCVRERTKLLVGFGDCAVTGNVTALRNLVGEPLDVLRSVYLEHGDLNAELPSEPGIVPPLLRRVQPVHEIVPVDVFLQGCPPPAPRIRKVLEAVVSDTLPQLVGEDRRFG
jgi:NAD-reducing hydrogenase small subunit